MLADTSLKAYRTEVKNTLLKRQVVVMKAFNKNGNMSNSELASLLGWPINTVTPRVNELVKLKRLTHIRTKKCKVTGRSVKEWGLPQSDFPAFFSKSVKEQEKVILRTVKEANKEQQETFLRGRDKLSNQLRFF